MEKKAKYEEAKREKEKKRDGVVVGVEAYTHSQTPLEQFRGPFYEQKAAEAEAIRDSRAVRPREHPPGWTPEADTPEPLDSAE